MKTHFFLAVPVSGQVQRFLSEWKDRNIGHFPFQKWVHHEDLHITLVFLGHIEKKLLHHLSDQLDELIKKHHSFSLTLGNLNTFGENSRPRIFWSGVENELSLFKLQKDIANTCLSLNLEIEKRPYRPHITLARRWKGDDNFSLPQATELFNQENKSSWKVDKVHLYQSHLGKSPMYEPIRTFFLQKEE
ncbi:2'-5' RNA ligase [Alkalihalophilus pseudofirmus]|nr:2'-5' RNA ligase [Alkalihalophilus pseudofirmus]